MRGQFKAIASRSFKFIKLASETTPKWLLDTLLACQESEPLQDNSGRRVTVGFACISGVPVGSIDYSGHVSRGLNPALRISTQMPRVRVGGGRGRDGPSRAFARPRIHAAAA